MRARSQAISEMVESPRRAIQEYKAKKQAEKKKRNEEKRALREAENKVRRQEAGVNSDDVAEAARRGLWKPVETDVEFRGVVSSLALTFSRYYVLTYFYRCRGASTRPNGACNRACGKIPVIGRK